MVLGLLLVDLSGRAAVLAKGLCVCYCRNPLAADSKKHSPCCRSCRRCEEQGSRQHSPRSAEQKPSVYSGARVSSPRKAVTASSRLRPCGLVCCTDTIDNDIMFELQKRRFFCCMCRCDSVEGEVAMHVPRKLINYVLLFGLMAGLKSVVYWCWCFVQLGGGVARGCGVAMACADTLRTLILEYTLGRLAAKLCSFGWTSLQLALALVWALPLW